jgi:hypothetical protein
MTLSGRAGAGDATEAVRELANHRYASNDVRLESAVAA